MCIPFADAFQRLLTAHGMPAISTFQRHSTCHPFHCRSFFGFHFCFRGVPFQICSTYWVWRLRLRLLPTPGLVGSPHVHSSCLAPVRFAGVNCQRTSACRPHGLSPRFLPTAGLYKRLSQPKKGSISAIPIPTPHTTPHHTTPHHTTPHALLPHHTALSRPRCGFGFGRPAGCGTEKHEVAPSRLKKFSGV
jgi:hypothetical protein